MSDTVPNNWGEDSITRFVDDAKHNIKATFANLQPEFRKSIEINDLYSRFSENLINPQTILPSFFFLRAHSSCLGGIRLSASGQIPEAYMVFRGCLENSLYGYYIHTSPDMGELWLKRHQSEEALKKMKNSFHIRTLLELLKNDDEQVGSVAIKLYERTIDYGAHPNNYSIFTNTQMKEEGTQKDFKVNYLSGGDSVAFGLCFKTNAQIGVCSLKIFQKVFKARFDLLGISADIEKVSQGL